MMITITKLVWEYLNEEKDDIKATIPDYVFRVEQMDRKKWWYMVWFQDKQIADGLLCNTREEAMLTAEIAYLKHLILTIKL